MSDKRVGPCGEHCAVVEECDERGHEITRLSAENAKLRAACKAGIRMVAAFEDALEEAGVVIRETGDSTAAAALKETGE